MRLKKSREEKKHIKNTSHEKSIDRPWGIDFNVACAGR